MQQASSYGAIISHILDSSVTHVLSDARLKPMEVARKLGCSSWNDVEDKFGKKEESPFFVSSTWFEVSERVSSSAPFGGVLSVLFG